MSKITKKTLKQLQSTTFNTQFDIIMVDNHTNTITYIEWKTAKPFTPTNYELQKKVYQDIVNANKNKH